MTDRIYSTSLPERDCPTSPTFVSGTYPSSSPPLSSSGTDLLSRRQMSEDESNEFQIDSTGMDSRSVSTTASDQRDYLDGGDLLRASATVNDGETLNHPLQKSRNSLGFDGNDGRTAATTPSPSTTTLSGTSNTFSSLEENSTAQTSLVRICCILAKFF